MSKFIAPPSRPWSQRTVQASTSAANGEYLLVDTSNGAVAVAAPTPAKSATFGVKWIKGAAAPTLTGAYSAAGTPLFVAVEQAMEFISDGTAWYRQVRPALAQLPDWPATADARYPLASALATVALTGSYNDLRNLPASSGASTTTNNVSYDVQVFATAGTATWTKPAGAMRTWAIIQGAGGGGASGQAYNTGSTGGGGGGGGAREEITALSSQLGATVTVVCGAGGAGGAATTSSGANRGSNGGTSSFGTLLAAGGKGAASTANGGTPTPAAAPGGAGSFSGGAGATAAAGGSPAGTGGSGGAAAGGGQGGGIGGDASAYIAGGAGGPGPAGQNYPAGGTGSSGSAAGNGTSAPVPPAGLYSGSGGGGGGSTTYSSAAGTGGTGGNGVYGSGGGGGGSSWTGAAGAGGNGGDGVVAVITECVVSTIVGSSGLAAAIPQTTWDIQTYSTAGAFTWTKPTGAMMVELIVQHAGGGGGGGGGSYSGSGGGSGGRDELVIPASALPATVTGTVGAGGTGGASGTGNGGNGGGSTFGTIVTGSFGGIGGIGSNTSTGATTGGAAGTGTLGAYPGGGGSYNAPGGGGGGAAGPGGSGVGGGGLGVAKASGATTAPLPPAGYAGGGGGGGGGGTLGGNGVAGGGGGAPGYSTAGAGGRGGDGVVIVRTLCVNTANVATTTSPVLAQSQLGQPNGVATLDGAGQVPLAQLGNVPQPLVARLTTAYVATTTTPTDILTLDNVGVGLYQLEIIGLAVTAGQAFQTGLAAANGLVLAAAGSTSTGPTAASSGTYVSNQYMNGSVVASVAFTSVTATGTAVATATQSAGSPSPLTIRGALRVTTAGSLKWRGNLAAAGTAWIDPGASMTLTKIG